MTYRKGRRGGGGHSPSPPPGVSRGGGARKAAPPSPSPCRPYGKMAAPTGKAREVTSAHAPCMSGEEVGSRGPGDGKGEAEREKEGLAGARGDLIVPLPAWTPPHSMGAALQCHPPLVIDSPTHPPVRPAMPSSSSSSSSSSCIILDDEDDDGPPLASSPAPGAAAAAASSASTSKQGTLLLPLGAAGCSSPPAEHKDAPPAPSGVSAPKPPTLGKDPASLKAENERLFAEFSDFCALHTGDHPEVMSYLASRHQKTNPDYLASVEFRNVLGRCLARVQARSSKVYVYINELCTVFKAHSQKRKTPAPAGGGGGGGGSPEATGAAPPAPAKVPPADAPGSKRHIRYLENLLRVYAEEIRRLQERELDLEELDRADSAYLQESRLKRRMMRVFQRLCELKDCNSLTGRVIEQRIPYGGTRYPEVNRRVERLINRHPEAFPDYGDILKAVQKASARHALGLAKPQVEALAAEAFREVGGRLQERRRLDLVYNFGSHLTDQYRPNTDPALTDPELSRRLRQNHKLGAQRLEEVITQYAQLQDQSREAADWHRQEAARAEPAKGPRAGEPASPAGAASGSAAPEASQGRSKQANEEEEEEEEDEEEEEEEEEEESSESDLEVDLATCLAGGEEEEALAPDEDAPAQEVEADQCMDLEVPEGGQYSSEEEEEEEEDDDNEEGPGGRLAGPLEEEEEEEGGEEEVAEQSRRDRPAGGPSPALSQSSPEQFLLEIEAALPLETGETPPPSPPPPGHPAQKQRDPQPPAKRPPAMENGGAAHHPDITALRDLNGQPPSKKARKEPRVSNSSCIEVCSTGSSEAEEDEEDVVLFDSLPPRSPAPVADSTCADSPSLSLVSSSHGSPQRRPRHQRLLASVSKTSVATQCDPEEIIVLSDSD